MKNNIFISQLIDDEIGVIRANPKEYINRFGDSLRGLKDLPDCLKNLESSTLGIELASEKFTNMPPELCGDIFALNLIDLDKEGLGEYKNFLNTFNQQRIKTGSAPTRRRFHSAMNLHADQDRSSPSLIEKAFEEVKKIFYIF